MDSSTGSVPHIISSAQISLTLGTLAIERLQIALSVLTQGRDLSGIEERIAAGTISEPAEQAIVGLSSILTHIYQVAQTTGQITMVPFDASGLQ